MADNKEGTGEEDDYSTKAQQAADNVIGSSAYLSGSGDVYLEASDFDYLAEDIPESLLVQPLKEKISHEVFWKLILNEKVPVTTSLVAVMGLPSSGKTTVLESILEQKIRLKEEAKFGFEYYLNRKRDENCLSIYDLCALGSSQHMFAWSFATNRYGAIFSILCNLIRRNPCVAHFEFEVKKQASPSVIQQHVEWLMKKTQNLLHKIKDEPGKLTLIQDGLSFINVIDVGVNKALYDFLSIMLLSCHRHIRLAFFSLDRDAHAPKLHERPDLPFDRYGKRKDNVIVMQQRSRLTYLLHFATVGYTTEDQHGQETKNATVMIATRKSSPAGTTPSLDQAKKEIIEQAKSRGVDRFLKKWIEIDINDELSIKEEFGQKMEDIIKNKYKQLTIQLPLRWIILRSLVVSLDSKKAKAMILHKEFILNYAKELYMDEEEVDKFLKAFTDFGSILYMPQYDSIKDIVIVNIWEFTQYLNKLYYPLERESYAANLLKYGIISESSVKGIFDQYPDICAEDYMKVLTTIAMASKINSGQSIFINNKQQPDEVHYYLPLARTHKVYVPPPEEENDYAFIEIESVNFPANVQACFSYAIMDNNEDAVLIATEYSNVSRFLFRSESGPQAPIEIEMVYKGSSTRLRIMNSSNDIVTSPAAVEACYKVIAGSCRCLERKINTIRDLKYSFAVPCHESPDRCHYLYYDCEPQLCDACSAEPNFRLCWSKAANKCEKLKKGDGARLKETCRLDIPLTLQDIAGLITDDYHFDTLKEALNVEDVPIPYPKDSEGKKKAMMLMLLHWENQTKTRAKHALKTILEGIGLTHIANKLDTEGKSVVY